MLKQIGSEEEYFSDLKIFAEEVMRMAAQQNKVVSIYASPPDEDTSETFLDIRLGDRKAHRWEGSKWYET